MSLTARCVCEAAGFYYTNNSTQFTCTFTSWKITCHDNCQKFLSVRALERHTSISVPDFAESWKKLGWAFEVCHVLVVAYPWLISYTDDGKSCKIWVKCHGPLFTLLSPQNVSANLCHKHFISVVCNFLIITISPFFFRINSFNSAS